MKKILLFLLICTATFGTDFSAWSHYIEVVVQHEEMDSDETALPVLIDLDELSASHNLWSTAQSDGDDLRASKSDGTTELDVELVSYDSVAEDAKLWVTLDSDDDADVTIRIYYGNAVVGPYASPTNVWTGWDWVYHMEESSGDLLDSGPNGWDLTNSGDLPTTTAGQVGLAQDLDGTGDHAENTSATHDLNNYTIMAWAYRPSSAGGYDTLASGSSSWRLQHTTSSSKVGWGQRETGQTTQTSLSNQTWKTNQWEHWVITRSGDSVEWFKNGSSDSTDTLTVEELYTTLRVGHNIAYGSGDNWDGGIDEFMAYGGILSTGAIGTMYSSMKDPSTFAEYGAHTVNSGGSPEVTSAAIIFFP